MTSVVLVTGVAGFIGYHTAKALVKRGTEVVGVDNIDPYYDVLLKRDRLTELQTYSNFTFHLVDIRDASAVDSLGETYSFTHIVHFAAQAGVRHSLSHPHKYVEVNVLGHLNILELARRLGIRHLVYASSSSVYGGNEKLPFAVGDPVDRPLSLYAATKRSAELMSYTYSHLFQIPCTGLRFFTVYGPWGRPDMAAFLFTKALLEGHPLRIFNHGRMKRNFTYVEDIVQGVVAALDKEQAYPLHRLYNLGNHKAEELMRFVQILEEVTGKKASLFFEEMQPGDVPETVADIASSRLDLGFVPKVSLEEGLASYVQWFKDYYGKRP